MVLALRWWIGLSCAAGLGLWALLLVVGRGMASVWRSGSGREVDWGELAVMAGVPLLLGAMLVSAMTPRSRWLLHAVAAGVAAALAGVVMIARTNPGEAALYALFFAPWVVYYLAIVRS